MRPPKRDGQAAAALATGVMRARRWRHHLEDSDRFASGTSWSRDPLRWRADHLVRIEVDARLVSNAIHAIPASRTHWRTLALLDPAADPRAWLDEPTEPDEEFIEGSIRGFHATLLGLAVVDGIAAADRERMEALLRACRPDLKVRDVDAPSPTP